MFYTVKWLLIKIIEKLAYFIEKLKQDFNDKHFNLPEIITSFFDCLLKHYLVSTNFNDVSDEELKRKKNVKLAGSIVFSFGFQQFCIFSWYKNSNGFFRIVFYHQN